LVCAIQAAHRGSVIELDGHASHTTVFKVPTGIERVTELVTPFVDLDLIRRGSDGSALF
jgi:hypothetical protein